MNPIYYLIITIVICACSTPKKASDDFVLNPSPAPLAQEELIQPHELPEGVFNNLQSDMIFSKLKLVEANKFRKSKKTYYDLKFKDEEQFTIMATFDESGNLVSL